MFAYIALFFILSFLFCIFLILISIIKCLGLVPLAKSIISKVFSSKYDKKYQQNQRGPLNSDCYICLQKSNFQIVTTCNHSYCGTCILDYIKSEKLKSSSQYKCPACRKQICILFRRQQPHNINEKHLKQQISQFNCQNSKQLSFFRAIFQFSSIIKHLGVLFSAEGIKFMLENPRIKNILMLVIYTLSPIDFMPEMILGPLGLADDTFVSMEILRQLSNLWIQFVRDEARRDRVQQ